MDDDLVKDFLLNASPDQYVELRNKLSQLDGVKFEDFVYSLNRIIELIN